MLIHVGDLPILLRTSLRNQEPSAALFLCKGKTETCIPLNKGQHIPVPSQEMPRQPIVTVSSLIFPLLQRESDHLLLIIKSRLLLLTLLSKLCPVTHNLSTHSLPTWGGGKYPYRACSSFPCRKGVQDSTNVPRKL